MVMGSTLWPYIFTVPCRDCANGASWIAQADRIQFLKPGMVRTVSTPSDLTKTFKSAPGLTIETWLTPSTVETAKVRRIVSYSDDLFHKNFTLGQRNSSLIFRLRTNAYRLAPEIAVANVFKPERSQHIVVSYDRSHCYIYVNGQLHSGPALRGDFSTWNPNYLFLLGNERTGDSPWLGTIENMVLYNRPLTAAEVTEDYRTGSADSNRAGVVALYDFSDGVDNIIKDTSGVEPALSLELPDSFVDESTVFLTLKQRKTRDFISNFLIFFPFGFLLLLNLLARFSSAAEALLALLCVTVLFSLTTESLQYYVAYRTSSFFDLVSCILGSLTGSYVGWRSRFYLKRYLS